MSTVTSRQVQAKAARGECLTLADLRAFVKTMDDAGAVGTTPVSARVSIGGKLRELSARAARPGDREAG